MADQPSGRERGGDSPASEEAKRQGMSGDRGHQAGRTDGSGHQPPQASDRAPGAAHQQEPGRRPSFEPGHAPSEPRDRGHPGPEQIARHQQGIGRQSGSRGAHTERSEQQASSCAPAGEHVRHGRRSVSGDRSDRQ